MDVRKFKSDLTAGIDLPISSSVAVVPCYHPIQAHRSISFTKTTLMMKPTSRRGLSSGKRPSRTLSSLEGLRQPNARR